MTTTDFKRVEAIHPRWSGILRIFAGDFSVLLEGPGTRGSFETRDRVLTIAWENNETDVFVELLGMYVHTDLLNKIPEAELMFAASVNKRQVIATRLSVLVPDTDYEVTLRLRSTDIVTFDQVFVASEYDSANLPDSAGTIVDLGANIGLATVFFALRYPDARILAVEPELGNFRAMVANTSALGARVQRRHGAVWVKDGSLRLHIEDENGFALEDWGVRVAEHGHGPATECFRLGTLLDQAGFTSVDILKIDIEGAELELFSDGAEQWLPKVKLIVVETHDRFRPGSDRAVRQAVDPLFEELPISGENLFFRRRSG